MEKVIQFDYKPLPSKMPFHTDEKRWQLLLGGLGDGKTVAMVNDIMTKLIRYPGAPGLLGRQTYREIEDTLIPVIIEWLPKDLLLRHDKEFNIMHFPNGSKLYLRSMDDPDKFGSLQLLCWGIDEARQIKEDRFTLLQGRLRWKPKGYSVPRAAYRGIVATNPPNKTHWLYRYFGPQMNENIYARWHGNTYENKDNLREGYIEELEETFKNQPNRLRKYIWGQWGADITGQPVHTGFLENIHVRKISPTKGNLMYCGWDFGAAHSGTAIAQFDEMGRFHVHAEVDGLGYDTLRLGRATMGIRARDFGEFVFRDYGDPSGSSRMITDSQTCVALVRDTFKTNIILPAKTSREQRAKMMDLWMNQITEGIPNFTVDPECITIIGALSGELSWAKNVKGENTEKIDEDVDCIHVYDGLSYMFLGINGPYAWRNIGAKNTKAETEEDYIPLERDDILGGLN